MYHVNVRRLQLKKPYLEDCDVDTTSSTGDDLTTYRIIVHRSQAALLRLCSPSSDYTRVKCYVRNLHEQEEFLLQVGDALAENETLTELSFQSNDLRDVGASALAAQFETNATLKIFEIFANGLGPTGTAALAKSLRNNTGLVTLNLSYNEKVGDEGALVLAEMLKTNQTLRILALEEDKVGDLGAIGLAEALQENQTLTQLNLNFNYTISDPGANAFAQSLRVNRCLITLSIKDNHIRNEGARALVAALASNRTLISLQLTEKHLDGEIKRGMENALVRNLEGQRAAFIEAQGSGRKAPWMRSKLMVVGEGMVGKTATVRSLLRKRFDKEWKSTVGVSLHEAKANDNNVWREGDPENFVDPMLRHMAVQYLQDKQEPNEDNVKQKKQVSRNEEEPVQEYMPTAPTTEVKTAMLGTEKVDDKEDVLAPTRVVRFTDETLAGAQTEGTKLRISVWDYGGQDVFYNLHHLFLTQFGCYLVVFNAQRLALHPEEAKTYLTFWMKSLRLHTNGAPMIMVGTFVEDMNGAEEVERVSSIVKELAQLCKVDTIGREEDSLAYFPIDNSTGEGVEVLRAKIQEVLLAQEYVRFNVSVQWMQVLDEMQSGSRRWIALKDVHEIVKSFGGMAASEVESMLSLFHELGVIIHFTMTENLKQIVTTDAQWLVDCISKVVRDHRIHKFDSEAITQVQLQDELSTFFKSGLVTRDLLEFLWEKDHVDFLVDLMRRLLLLSHWRFATATEDELYLVPGMVPQGNHEKELEKMVENNAAGHVWMEFSFEFLPIGVFERLVCLCVDYSTSLGSQSEPILSKGFCKVWIKPEMAMVISKEEDRVKATVLNAEFAGAAMMLMVFMVKKIKADVMGPRFEWSLALQHNSDAVEYEDARRRKLKPWFEEKENDDHLGGSGLDLNAFIGTL